MIKKQIEDPLTDMILADSLGELVGGRNLDAARSGDPEVPPLGCSVVGGAFRNVQPN